MPLFDGCYDRGMTQGTPLFDACYDRGIKVYLLLTRAAIEVLRYTSFWLNWFLNDGRHAPLTQKIVGNNRPC